MYETSHINEINFIDDIDDIEKEYRNSFGLPVLNISDWNSSKEFKVVMSKLLCDKIQINDLDYIFSYSTDKKTIQLLLKKFGFKNTNKSVLLTHSGSASIFNVINLLKEKGIKNLYVLCPGYFTIFHACSIFDINCIPLYLKRSGHFEIDYDEILKTKKNDCAYWVTNPIYCTSVYYSDEDINFFKILLKNSVVVFDECLSFNGRELCRILGDSKNFIGIYSPHKSICINSFKFSMVVCSEIYQNFLDAWADVFCGCLNNSCEFAIQHFLSNNFDYYYNIFKCNIIDKLNSLKQICLKENVELDENANGYLISMYFRQIDAQNGLDLDFIKTILFNTGIRFIPGIRNHFDKNMGLNFRINLTTLNDSVLKSIKYLVEYLNNL